MSTNNCIRLLNSQSIPHKLFTLSNEKRTAIEVAKILNVDPYLVNKTIVIKRENNKRPVLAVIPGPLEVDLRKVANFLDDKKVKLPTQTEAEKITGLFAGGISPLALINKGFKVILDELSLLQPDIIISGGERGLSIQLSVDQFIHLTSASIADIT